MLIMKYQVLETDDKNDSFSVTIYNVIQQHIVERVREKCIKTLQRLILVMTLRYKQQHVIRVQSTVVYLRVYKVNIRIGNF